MGRSRSTRREPTFPSWRPPCPITYNHCMSISGIELGLQRLEVRALSTAIIGNNYFYTNIHILQETLFLIMYIKKLNILFYFINPLISNVQNKMPLAIGWFSLVCQNHSLCLSECQNKFLKTLFPKGKLRRKTLRTALIVAYFSSTRHNWFG